MNDWRKMLNDMAITTDKPIDASLIYMGMLIDLYQSTKSQELKKELEDNFIYIFRTTRGQ